MHFDDTPEEAAFRKEVRSWLEANAERKGPEAAKELPSIASETDDTDVLPRARHWQKKLAQARLTAIGWPEEYGGRGAQGGLGMVLGQEMGGYDIPTQVFAIGIGMIGPTLLTHGTAEQKERFVGKILHGDEIWCQLWSEPNAGSDLASLQTRAVQDSASGDWIVSGQKVWTTGAHFSDWGLCVTRTDPDVPKHQGITVFIIDMKAPGVTVRPLRQITGGAGFNEVFMDEVRVPDAHRVGDVNGGWMVATTTLMNERFAILGGGASGSFDPLQDMLKEEGPDGHRPIDDRAVRQRFADVYIRGRLMSLTGMRAITKFQKGQIPGPEGSILKLVAGQLMSDFTGLGMDVLGLRGIELGSGAAEGGRWPIAWLGAPGIRIGGGTDEVMRNIIGERVLALPKEPSTDRGVPFRELMTGTTG